MKKSTIIPHILALLFSLPCAMEAQEMPIIDVWKSTADESMKFQQDRPLEFSYSLTGKQLPIIINPRQTYQQMEGFGFAITGGSAEHLMRMSPSKRHETLVDLFDPDHSGISYIRLTVGASDLNSFVFSYDDMPEGKSDPNLENFSLSQDLFDVVPVMREILEIRPDIYIIASPWSAPAWMKSYYDVRGSRLREECYDVYARYLVKYVQAMSAEGINLYAVTPQNEPLNSRNTPSMPWQPEEMAEFVGKYLGPRFEEAGLDTKIIIFDHNCDRPDYPLVILSDPEIAKYVSGSGFHHYMGDLSAMTLVHRMRPDKDIYFTEQMITEPANTQRTKIAATVKRVIIDVSRNWSRNSILWNLAADPFNDPHTDNGGCSMCQGAITINGNIITKNLAYFAVLHASKFVTPGSFRISSTAPYDPGTALFEDEQRPAVFRALTYDHSNVMPNVAFKTPEGKIVLIVANTSFDIWQVPIQYNGMYAILPLEPGSVGTYVWNE